MKRESRNTREPCYRNYMKPQKRISRVVWRARLKETYQRQAGNQRHLVKQAVSSGCISSKSLCHAALPVISLS